MSRLTLACVAGTLALLQLWLCLPLVAGNRSLDIALWTGGVPLFRVDGLALVFGVVWSFAVGTASLSLPTRSIVPAASMLAGLLTMAYAREPIVFAVGWELTAVGAWYTSSETNGKRQWSRLALWNAPGLLLLIPSLFGMVWAFAPPLGGQAREWPLFIAMPIGFAVLLRLLLPILTPANPILNKSSQLALNALHTLYAASAPFILVKMLVAGRWDAWTAWVLALLATMALLALVSRSLRTGSGTPVESLAAISVSGLALASISPLAGLGAVLLMTAAALCATLVGHYASRYIGTAMLAGSLPAIWLVTQGALSARYSLITVLALPALLLAASLYLNRQEVAPTSEKASRITFATTALVLCMAALYPQATVAWIARPALQALAGGVGTPDLALNWGTGLTAISPTEAALASLPAAGIAVALFLAWITLYGMKELAKRISQGITQHQN